MYPDHNVLPRGIVIVKTDPGYYSLVSGFSSSGFTYPGYLDIAVKVLLPLDDWMENGKKCLIVEVPEIIKTAWSVSKTSHEKLVNNLDPQKRCYAIYNTDITVKAKTIKQNCLHCIVVC